MESSKSAKGQNSKVASVGMQVVLDLARNCTDISPCQQDTAIIRDAEIKANVVNQCGRTELAGNIDVGENTENQLAANQVADVVAGDTVDVVIHQVNADGAGPYTCDLDETSNTGVFTRTNLPIKNNVPGTNGLSQAKEQDFKMQVSLPKNLNCTGASTGNICTLRCRNNALAGPFGGCVALQQTDHGAGRQSADPASITTSNTLAEVDAQVAINQNDLNKAIAANKVAGSSEADKGSLRQMVSFDNLLSKVLADILFFHVALISGAGINTAVSDPTSVPAAVAPASTGASTNGRRKRNNGRASVKNQNTRRNRRVRRHNFVL